MVDKQRIKNLLKLDKSSWLTRHCRIPIESISININGDVHFCFCHEWLPKTICNILNFDNKEDFFKVLNDNEVRTSIIDRSHRYCIGVRCPQLQNEYDGESTSFNTLEEILKMELITLNLSLDESCNLVCPSCRNSVILNKNNIVFQNKLKKILNKIDEFLFQPQIIENIFGIGNGEFLASKLLTDWFIEKSKLDINFWLQTNGTLIYKNKDKITDILKQTKTINVSIDASNEEIYSKVRLNGKWNDLINGLNYLVEERKKKPFILRFNFTISDKNFEDVLNFIDFAKRFNVDEIYFTRVRRWPHIKESDWQEMNVFSPNHPQNSKLLEIISHEKMSDKIINVDF